MIARPRYVNISARPTSARILFTYAATLLSVTSRDSKGEVAVRDASCVVVLRFEISRQILQDKNAIYYEQLQIINPRDQLTSTINNS